MCGFGKKIFTKLVANQEPASIKRNVKILIMVNSIALYDKELERQLYNFRAEIVAGITNKADLLKALKQAKKNDLNKLHYEFAYFLFHHCSVRETDFKLYNYAKQEMNLARELRDIEEKAWEGYMPLSKNIIKTGKVEPAFYTTLQLYTLQMEGYLQLKNAKISMPIYKALVHKAYFDKDFEKVRTLCAEAISFYDAKKINKSFHFKMAILPLLIIDKEYRKASRYIDFCKAQCSSKKVSAAGYHLYGIYNFLHSGKYQQALQGFLLNNKSGIQHRHIAEQWIILEGYFQFLLNAGLISHEGFRIGKVLNSTPKLNADKHGYFANTLILKLLIYIQSDREKAIDSCDPISQSLSRYIEKNSRQYIFIKMLLLVISNHFVKEEVAKQTKSHLESLNNTPMNPELLDIIPYPKLWDIITKSL